MKDSRQDIRHLGGIGLIGVAGEKFQGRKKAVLFARIASGLLTEVRVLACLISYGQVLLIRLLSQIGKHCSCQRLTRWAFHFTDELAR